MKSLPNLSTMRVFSLGSFCHAFRTLQNVSHREGHNSLLWTNDGWLRSDLAGSIWKDRRYLSRVDPHAHFYIYGYNPKTGNTTLQCTRCQTGR